MAKDKGGWSNVDLAKRLGTLSGTVDQLPAVGRIQGASIDLADTHEASVVRLQYTDQNNKWHELRMPFLDAMYLLNLLKGIQTETRFAASDDAPLN